MTNKASFFIVLLFLIICSSKAFAGCVKVIEGQPIQMGERDCLTLHDSGYTLKLNKFYNDPCPKNTQCVWPGVGVGFTHEFYGQVMQGINLIQAFGFDLTIHKTDHKTFALISVQKLKSE